MKLFNFFKIKNIFTYFNYNLSYDEKNYLMLKKTWKDVGNILQHSMNKFQISKEFLNAKRNKQN